MAIYFHAHARRKIASPCEIDGIILSPREAQCLQWASEGKSAWETGQIMGISHHTVAFHLEMQGRSSAFDQQSKRSLVSPQLSLAFE
jgi:transposase-like protein